MARVASDRRPRGGARSSRPTMPALNPGFLGLDPLEEEEEDLLDMAPPGASRPADTSMTFDEFFEMADTMDTAPDNLDAMSLASGGMGAGMPQSSPRPSDPRQASQILAGNEPTGSTPVSVNDPMAPGPPAAQSGLPGAPDLGAGFDPMAGPTQPARSPEQLMAERVAAQSPAPTGGNPYADPGFSAAAPQPTPAAPEQAVPAQTSADMMAERMAAQSPVPQPAGGTGFGWPSPGGTPPQVEAPAVGEAIGTPGVSGFAGQAGTAPGGAPSLPGPTPKPIDPAGHPGTSTGGPGSPPNVPPPEAGVSGFAGQPDAATAIPGMASGSPGSPSVIATEQGAAPGVSGFAGQPTTQEGPQYGDFNMANQTGPAATGAPAPPAAPLDTGVSGFAGQPGAGETPGGAPKAAPGGIPIPEGMSPEDANRLQLAFEQGGFDEFFRVADMLGGAGADPAAGKPTAELPPTDQPPGVSGHPGQPIENPPPATDEPAVPGSEPSVEDEPPPPPPDLGGDIYEWTPPGDKYGNQTGEITQNVLDALQGKAELESLAPIMAGVDQRFAKELSDLKERLAIRGISNSSIADDALAQLAARQASERAGIRNQVLSQQVGLNMGVTGSLGAEGRAGRGQSFGEFTGLFDRDRAMGAYEDQRQMQGLQTMLNAMGVGTMQPVQPAYNVPGAQPGQSAAGAIGNIAGNVAVAGAGNPNFDWSKFLSF